jgi:PAS domain S-box-containing protein
MAGGRRDSSAWLGLSLGAFALIACGLFGAATLADRGATLEQGWTEADNTAALLAEHADRALRVAEISTARIAEAVARDGLGALRDQGRTMLATLLVEAPEISALTVLDAAGQVVAASPPRPGGDVDAPGPGALAMLANGTDRHLSALHAGRLTNAWLFTWSRALRQDGQLIGVVRAALFAQNFAAAAEDLALGPDARLALLREDGATVAQWPLPGPPAMAGPHRGRTGRQVEVGPDGVARLVSWHAAAVMPVVAVAAISQDHVLASFRQRLARNGLLFALSALLAGWLAAAAIASNRRERAARHAAEERGAALGAALAEREGLLTSVQESEARLRLAEQAGGIGLWDWDLRDGRLALVGDVYARWGVPVRRRIPARIALRGVRPEDRADVGAALAAALRGAALLEAEFRLAGPGPSRWIAVRAEVRRDATGQPRRLLGVALDTTAQRQEAAALAETNAMLERRVAERTGALADANARLREGEARFRGIFDATFQVIALLSPDGTVLEANEALLQLGRTDRSGVLGRPYWEAPCWPSDAATRAALREAVGGAAEGRFVRRELSLPDAEGTPRAIDVSVKPVRDEDGLVSLLVAEGRDVSELKSAQALLLEAQKMDTLGQLTGGVAHDFNNLLMAVLGNLALARRRLGPAPEVLRHLDAAVQGAERGAQLTQRLLAFARRQDLRPASVDLAALLAGMGDLLRRSAGQLVELVVHAPAGLPPAHVDAHALELALMNLAVNARDAMPEGGRLSVTVAPAPEAARPKGLPPGRYVCIAVADTGHGMDAATLARAVEPFFSTKGPGQGTGLGLSMVHGLAHQSGGALTIDSAPGSGTLATLWLPVSTAAPAPAPIPKEAEPLHGSGAVLVVDDEALVLESTAAMLDDIGYEAVPASSGEGALAALAERPDVVAVVTDHAMPGMTGAALAARIATLRPGLPVILATGHGGAWSEAPELFGRLTKPYTLAQLSAALHAALQRSAAAE